MTPTEQDKELEAQLDKIFPCDCSFIKGFAFKPGDPCDGSCVNAPYRRAVLRLITANYTPNSEVEKQVREAELTFVARSADYYKQWESELTKGTTK